MLTALYDGNCVICQSTCETMRALDWLRRIDFVDLHQAEAESERFADLDRRRLMREIHVLDADGGLYAGFAGMRRMLREVRRSVFPCGCCCSCPAAMRLASAFIASSPAAAIASMRCWAMRCRSCADDSCEMLL